ncbi:hypothetical protein [Thiocapsa sp.]|uniref:hypothetical protein n=1 Tax=Thiocapsa sp. TaxID=2024551 RepID=UPI003593F1F9
MSVLSIDLAYKHYKDIGVAVLDTHSGYMSVKFVKIPLAGEPQPEALADFIVGVALEVGATLLLVDGPQGWKSPGNGLVHSRVCERRLNTPAKTGLPHLVKPANYGPFVEFSIRFFDELSSRDWPRLREPKKPGRNVAIETFPFSAWKSLGIAPLPAKSKVTGTVLDDRKAALARLFPIALADEPNHDELQAMVAGFGGLALERDALPDVSFAGESPFVLAGLYREGFIVNPVRPFPKAPMILPTH